MNYHLPRNGEMIAVDLRHERVVAVMTEKGLRPGQAVTVTIVRDDDNIFVARV